MQDARILIVDDEEANVRLLEKTLSRAGYTDLMGTTDSRQVPALCAGWEPDLVLLDLLMPHIDGFAVLQQLDAMKNSGDYLPVLVLTADCSPETKHRALQGGATDFLTKPFDRAEVLLRIRNLLETRRLHRALTARNHDLEAEVRERTRELEAAQHQLVQQERMSALGMMASGIAHDFNNALALILGYGEMLLRDRDETPRDEVTTHYLETIISAAQDAGQVVERLRQFNRPDGDDEVRLAVNLNTLAEQALSFTAPKWKSQALGAGVDINVRTDLEDVPPVSGNAAELREVLTNLIFNAVDAMPEGGTIAMRTRSDFDMVCLEVSDTGTGMTEEVRRRCLEPFFTTKGKRGTGLGLAMVFGIIQRHGGTIAIESELGHGTTFVIRLPASVAVEDIAPDVPETLDRPLRLLIVEDEPVFCEIIAEYLSHDWHTVETATNGREALEKFRAGTFDVIITDQGMPEMNGAQLAAAIKEVDPDQPIIMLTGFGDLVEATGDNSAAIDLLVRKPVTLAALRQAIAGVLKNRVQTPEPGVHGSPQTLPEEDWSSSALS